MPRPSSRLYSAMGPGVEISGGSAANTMVGLASFGGRAAFIGKVAEDEFGRIFRHDIRAAGVTFKSEPVVGKTPTSRSLILVTPDGQRTMNTFLGISTDLDHGEVDPALIRNSSIVYLEGYLFDRPEAKAAFRQAVAIATSAGAPGRADAVGFILRQSASGRSFWSSSVPASAFCSPTRARSWRSTKRTSFDEAMRRAGQDTSSAVLTRSEKGSVIVVGRRSRSSYRSIR